MGLSTKPGDVKATKIDTGAGTSIDLSGLNDGLEFTMPEGFDGIKGLGASLKSGAMKAGRMPKNIMNLTRDMGGSFRSMGNLKNEMDMGDVTKDLSGLLGTMHDSSGLKPTGAMSLASSFGNIKKEVVDFDEMKNDEDLVKAPALPDFLTGIMGGFDDLASTTGFNSISVPAVKKGHLLQMNLDLDENLLQFVTLPKEHLISKDDEEEEEEEDVDEEDEEEEDEEEEDEEE